MADLSSNFLGIQSPNPFWLASAPPTDKEYNVVRAFEAGWGGVVWKTLGLDPHVVNVSGPRYSTLRSQDRKIIGLNNIELITDRSLVITSYSIHYTKLYEAMVQGLRAPQKLELELLHTYGTGRLDTFWLLRLPSSLPYLFPACRVAIASGLVGTIVAELPTGAQAGLGSRLLTGSYYGNTVQIWSALRNNFV